MYMRCVFKDRPKAAELT